MRLLRSYERTAQKEHDCDRCQSVILPGDIYTGEIYVSEKMSVRKEDRITVYKTHINPSRDFPELPEEESVLEDLVRKAA